MNKKYQIIPWTLVLIGITIAMLAMVWKNPYILKIGVSVAIIGFMAACPLLYKL